MKQYILYYYFSFTECTGNYYGENCALPCNCGTNGASCNNVNGACVCKAGWEGTRCEKDVNECARGNHNCTGLHALCLNVDGGVQCGCVTGYVLNRTGVCTGESYLPGYISEWSLRSENFIEKTLKCFIALVMNKI